MHESTFSELGVSPPVVGALALRGIDSPFPIQQRVLGDAMIGLDVLARSPTGSGKTLAFAIPIVERLEAGGARPAALVLVPTRELASQVALEFAAIARTRKLRVEAVYGGVGIGDQGRRASRADILIATPGRMEDQASRRLVRLDSIQILILDEADRMLDMGFQPQVDRIVRRLPANRQTMFFSATLDGEVGRIAHAYTRHPVVHEVDQPMELVREAVHRFIPVTSAGKVAALVELLRSEQGTALVFVATKRGADRLVIKLRSHGVRATAMHGDMRQAAREHALAGFASGAISTLVATDVASRGIDLDNITHVINFDPPGDDKGYLHRVGRTARAGRVGAGVTLVLPDQQSDVSRIASRLKLREEFEEEGMKVAPPRLLYASRRGRKSMLAGRRGRRF